MFGFMNSGKSKPVKKGLKIIIVGCGKVGTTLVEQLSKEGHDIIIIDKNAKKVQEIANMYDIMGIVGNGASYSVQMDAGIDETDMIISVTESDELNMLCCTVAKKVGDCAAIARVRTPDYSKEAGYLREKLGLAMIINPELEAARAVSYTHLDVYKRQAYGTRPCSKYRKFCRKISRSKNCWKCKDIPYDETVFWYRLC